MKNSILMAAASMALATSAMAAKTSLLPAGSTQVAAVQSAPSTVVAPSESALRAPTSATVSAKTESVIGAKSKFSPSYVAESLVDMNELNKGTHNTLESQQHVGVAYDLGDARKIQYRQYFHYNMTDRERPEEWGMGDHVIQYTDAQAAKIGNADVSAYARFYLPGAKYAKETGKYELRLVQTTAQALAPKWTLQYALNTRIYTYTQDNDGQRGLRFMPAIELAYEANSTWTPYVGAFIDRSWYHNGSGPAILGATAGEINNPLANREVFYTDVGAKVNVTKNVSLNMFIETAKEKNTKHYIPFDQDRSIYELDLSVSM